MVVMKGCFTCGKLGVTVAHGVARNKCHTVCHSHPPVRISVGTDLSPLRQTPKPGVYKTRAMGHMRNAIFFCVVRGHVCKVYIGVYIYIYIYI
jgi:hypothetical protein